MIFEYSIFNALRTKGVVHDSEMADITTLVIDDIYNNPKRFSKPCSRIHGGAHISRTAMWFLAFHQVFAHEFMELSSTELKAGQIACLMHASGREEASIDLQDEHSATNTYRLLHVTLGFDHETAILWAEAIANKNKPPEEYVAPSILADNRILWLKAPRETKPIPSQLVQMANCLDMIRVSQVFNVTRLSIWNSLLGDEIKPPPLVSIFKRVFDIEAKLTRKPSSPEKQTKQQLILKMVNHARHLIFEQGDLPGHSRVSQQVKAIQAKGFWQPIHDQILSDSLFYWLINHGYDAAVRFMQTEFETFRIDPSRVLLHGMAHVFSTNPRRQPVLPFIAKCLTGDGLANISASVATGADFTSVALVFRIASEPDDVGICDKDCLLSATRDLGSSHASIHGPAIRENKIQALQLAFQKKPLAQVAKEMAEGSNADPNTNITHSWSEAVIRHAPKRALLGVSYSLDSRSSHGLSSSAIKFTALMTLEHLKDKLGMPDLRFYRRWTHRRTFNEEESSPQCLLEEFEVQFDSYLNKKFKFFPFHWSVKKLRDEAFSQIVLVAHDPGDYQVDTYVHAVLLPECFRPEDWAAITSSINKRRVQAIRTFIIELKTNTQHICRLFDGSIGALYQARGDTDLAETHDEIDSFLKEFETVITTSQREIFEINETGKASIALSQYKTGMQNQKWLTIHTMRLADTYKQLPEKMKKELISILGFVIHEWTFQLNNQSTVDAEARKYIRCLHDVRDLISEAPKTRRQIEGMLKSAAQIFSDSSNESLESKIKEILYFMEITASPMTREKSAASLSESGSMGVEESKADPSTTPFCEAPGMPRHANVAPTPPA